jgi:D-galactose 1-dehydrogenase
VDGQEQAAEGTGEYPDLYRSFADLIDCRQSLVDVEPLRLVADSLLVGERTEVAAITL